MDRHCPTQALLTTVASHYALTSTVRWLGCNRECPFKDRPWRLPISCCNCIRSPSINPLPGIREARRYEIGSRLHYAKHIEFGTGPHTSSTGKAEFERNLRDWHGYVGLPSDSYGAVKKAIQRRGLPPRPFLRPAFVKERDNFPITFADELIRLLPPSIK